MSNLTVERLQVTGEIPDSSAAEKKPVKVHAVLPIPIRLHWGYVWLCVCVCCACVCEIVHSV